MTVRATSLTVFYRKALRRLRPSSASRFGKRRST